MAEDMLNKIAAQKASEYDYRGLSDIRSLLDDIGCEKYTNSVNEIMSAGKRGHIAFAVDSAKKFLPEFHNLRFGIIAARKSEESEEITEEVKAYNARNESLGDEPLKKALQVLEQHEATRKMRILAIDDSAVMLKLISSVLSNEYKVYGLINPMMLEKFLKQITPELFLLDYKMPIRTGFDLIPIIKSFKEHKDTPIIFLTSIGTINHVSAAFALGACDYIVKPSREGILREKIAKHIVRKKLF
jgi:PleD family two-component response regulator